MGDGGGGAESEIDALYTAQTGVIATPVCEGKEGR